MQSKKNLLRKEMLIKRDLLTPKEIEDKSGLICQNLLMLKEYLQACTLLVYLSFRQEVNTLPLIENAWQQGKKVLVPVCMPEKNILLSELKNLRELAGGFCGIPEPTCEFIRPASPSQVDLAILPGVAFDFRGYRLGYGGGYFDRFLAKHYASFPLIALAYDFQLIDALPVEEHDMRVDIIVTEKKIYYAETTRKFLNPHS